LLRLDGAGQVRRGLAIDWIVAIRTSDPWSVELTFGRWQLERWDGRQRPMTSSQHWIDAVLPTQRSIRCHSGEPRSSTVVSGWCSTSPMPPGRISSSRLGGVIPADLDDTNFDQDIPVSGGWFQLAERTPGLSLRFTAHPDTPLGVTFGSEFRSCSSRTTKRRSACSMQVESMRSWATWRSIRSVRAQASEDVDGAAPLGGTLVTLDYQTGRVRSAGPDRADLRRGVGESIGLEELVEGLVGVAGSVAASPWASVDVPLAVPPGEVREGQSMTVLFPRDVGVLGFAVRVMQRDLQARGIATTVIAEVDPRLHQEGPGETDAAMVVRRLPPRPALGRWLDDPAIGHAAGARGNPDHPDVRDALLQVAREQHITPLFRMGVLHAWRGIDGIRPSSWPGIGFWNAGEWTRPS
jgi:hypothetical protein